MSLKGSRVYLCGAMSLCEDNGVQWREALRPFLKGLGIKIFDPTNKPIDIGVEDPDLQKRLREEHNWTGLSKMMKEIRCVDLRMVDVTDFVIANIDLNHYTCGTWEEIFLANRERKPILVHCEQGKENIPGWLFGTIPHELFFSTWEELKTYLLEINKKTDGVCLFRRWYIFDHLKT